MSEQMSIDHYGFYSDNAIFFSMFDLFLIRKNGVNLTFYVGHVEIKKSFGNEQDAAEFYNMITKWKIEQKKESIARTQKDQAIRNASVMIQGKTAEKMGVF